MLKLEQHMTDVCYALKRRLDGPICSPVSRYPSNTLRLFGLSVIMNRPVTAVSATI